MAAGLFVIGGLFSVSVAAKEREGSNAATDKPVFVNLFSGQENIQAEGRTMSNVHYSYCHGPTRFRASGRAIFGVSLCATARMLPKYS